ncbi:hypothetical protein PZ740_06760, partial [Rhodospirillales bacterium YIM 152171]|nr:hypothetical protein [Marinimicrococcus flavescens]
ERLDALERCVLDGGGAAAAVREGARPSPATAPRYRARLQRGHEQAMRERAAARTLRGRKTGENANPRPPPTRSMSWPGFSPCAALLANSNPTPPASKQRGNSRQPGRQRPSATNPNPRPGMAARLAELEAEAAADPAHLMTGLLAMRGGGGKDEPEPAARRAPASSKRAGRGP